VKVGSSGAEVEDSTTEALEEASLTTLDAAELASERTDWASALAQLTSRAVERTAAAVALKRILTRLSFSQESGKGKMDKEKIKTTMSCFQSLVDEEKLVCIVEVGVRIYIRGVVEVGNSQVHGVLFKTCRARKPCCGAGTGHLTV
jgi:hypothetical protein